MGILNAADRPISHWSSYVIATATPGDDRVSFPTQGSLNVCLNLTNRGRKSSYLGSTPPLTVWKPQFHWLQSLISSNSTAAPHPSRMMIDAHQPIDGGSVAHGGDRVPSLVQQSSECLQPQQRGNVNHDLPGRCISSHAVPTPTSLAYFS